MYIGNLTNVLSKDYQQLKMLGIKTIIHFTPEKLGQCGLAQEYRELNLTYDV